MLEKIIDKLMEEEGIDWGPRRTPATVHLLATSEEASSDRQVMLALHRFISDSTFDWDELANDDMAEVFDEGTIEGEPLFAWVVRKRKDRSLWLVAGDVEDPALYLEWAHSEADDDEVSWETYTAEHGVQ